jgi:hypothetical protein
MTADVLYHPAWRKLLGRARDIQSTRDQNLNTLRDRIVTALQSDPSLAATVRADPAQAGRCVAKWLSEAASAMEIHGTGIWVRCSGLCLGWLSGVGC